MTGEPRPGGGWEEPASQPEARGQPGKEARDPASSEARKRGLLSLEEEAGAVPLPMPLRLPRKGTGAEEGMRKKQEGQGRPLRAGSGVQGTGLDALRVQLRLQSAQYSHQLGSFLPEHLAAQGQERGK